MSLGIKGEISGVADRLTDMWVEIIKDLLIGEGLEPTEENVDKVIEQVVEWYK